MNSLNFAKYLIMCMNKYIYLVIIVLLAGACSEYDKILKSDDPELKYQKAFEYYEEEDYARASTLFEYIVPIYKATNKASRVEFYHAKSLYYLGDYRLAAYHFKEFSENYGNSQYVEEADFLRAFCFYELSPRYSLDQQFSRKAINAFKLFIMNHPNSEKAEVCKEKIAELNNKLVKKSYFNAKLYFDLGDYKASIVALKNSLEEYPSTIYREDILFLILKSSYLLAENSVIEKRKERFQTTMDEYYSFIDEYPDSKKVEEAKHIYEESLQVLNN